MLGSNLEDTRIYRDLKAEADTKMTEFIRQLACQCVTPELIARAANLPVEEVLRIIQQPERG
jgi:hypothetical protein